MGGRNLRPRGKGGDKRGSPVGRSSLSSLVFPRSEEKRGMAPIPEPQATQQELYQDQEIQDGDAGYGPCRSETRPVGRLPRSQGRIPSHPDSQGGPEVPSLPLSGSLLPILVPPVRSVHFTEGKSHLLTV